MCVSSIFSGAIGMPPDVKLQEQQLVLARRAAEDRHHQVAELLLDRARQLDLVRLVLLAPALDRLLAQADRQRQLVGRRLLEPQHGLEQLEVVLLEQRAVDVGAAIEQRLRALARLRQPLARLLHQHLRQRRPVDVVLQRPVAAVHHLRPGADEVGVVDVDLDLLEVAGPQLAHAGLEVLGGGRGAAGEGIDLADLARPAGGGGGGQKQRSTSSRASGWRRSSSTAMPTTSSSSDGGEQPRQRRFRRARCVRRASGCSAAPRARTSTIPPTHASLPGPGRRPPRPGAQKAGNRRREARRSDSAVQEFGGPSTSSS